MTARRRAVAGAVAAAALLLGLAAAPASAGPDDLVVTIDEPDDADLSDSSVTVSGTVDTRPGLTLLSTSVDRIVVRIGGGPEVEVCRPSGPPCGGTPAPFSATFTMARNGAYEAVVSAEGQGQLLGVGLSSVGGRSTRPFRVAAPPRPPQDVRVDVSAERMATVSWARNLEPDMLHYLVRRKAGAGSFSPPQEVAHPGSGRASFVDRGTVAGGDFTYRIVAVRRGATGDSTVDSSSTDSRPVSVAAPPPPTDPAAAGTGPGATGDPAAPGDPRRLDVSAFLASQPGPALPAPARVLELPDTGFNRDLPFGARPPGEELEEGDELADPRRLDVGTSTSEFVSRGRPLVPVAGGAVLLLLAMHLRLLNKRVRTAPVTVSGPVPRDDLPHLDLAPADPAPEAADQELASRQPPPGPLLFDYEDAADPMADVEDDDAWCEEGDEEEVWEVVSPAR